MNAFSIDVEEWFCSHNLQGVVSHSDWYWHSSRVEYSMYYLLDVLDKHNIEATFFVLAWVAERHPSLVKEMYKRGHEIASHGYAHRLLTSLTPHSFREDIHLSIDVLANLIGERISGYRAPAFSITHTTSWAIDILKEANILYDSSIYPLSYHPDYGVADAPLQPFMFENGVWEIPLSCISLRHIRIPCSGGAYFRLFPYWLFKAMVHGVHKQHRSLVFYLHPWELDPDIPKIALPRAASLRHYSRLSSTKEKLQKLLVDFSFTSIRKLYSSLLQEGDGSNSQRYVLGKQ